VIFEVGLRKPLGPVNGRNVGAQHGPQGNGKSALGRFEGDAERQHKDDGDAKPGALADGAEGKAEIAAEELELGNRSVLAACLFELRDTAEPAFRGVAGVFGRKTPALEFSLQEGEVLGDFPIEFAVAAAGGK